MSRDIPPLFLPKAYEEPSVFQVGNLMREARRQLGLHDRSVPEVCLLDPDGDVVRTLQRSGPLERHDGWACYHSDLWCARVADREVGIVPCAVGAPYAVLVAEELHASGCQLVVSVTSAGRILSVGDPPYFVLIEHAWRDEGTSLHYLPPSEWASMRQHLRDKLAGEFSDLDQPVLRGSSWTTDAPFRETARAIERAEAAGIHAVEMEAAALYAYAHATRRNVVCIAHVTNTMAVNGDDFEKGHDDGTHQILAVLTAIADRVVGSTRSTSTAPPTIADDHSSDVEAPEIH